ncbi:MAG: dihydroorotate dehydrogenase [Treponema sp.]|nr:dihydroorotate dehydrogenase [Treponema sp.]
MTDFCQDEAPAIFQKATVLDRVPTPGAVPGGSVHTLSLLADADALPAAGQFFMLRSEMSQELLARPISVFSVKLLEGQKKAKIDFLILKKGNGTRELCALKNGDRVELLGPCGNSFPTPDAQANICLAGAGVGIAPIAGFASTLPESSYDFFASFKSGSYGLENVRARELVITTDDGSQGIHGMISAALTASYLREKKYTAVYACGPAPMLRYVQGICREANVLCYLSLEQKMACGMGVCLGCTVQTVEGYKRCCKDGPVFVGQKIIFEDPLPAKKTEPADKVDLSARIGSLRLKNPVIASSGTFGFGSEYESVFDVSCLGAISSKGLTLEPRQGNTGIRIWETPSGLMNSIGLQNPGIPHFIKDELLQMKKLGTAVIANLSGSTFESYRKGAELLEASDVDAIELNISCPNVSTGGAALGMTCQTAADITQRIRDIVTKPLIVKLTPQASDVAGVAVACIKSGADAVSLCNSFQGVAIDIERGVPVFDKIKAGFGGPAVRPIAVRLVWEVVEAVNKLPESERVPVIGIGGIATWRDAVEFIMAGAEAVQVGTATFSNPFAMKEIVEGLEAFMKRKGYKTIGDFRGIARSGAQNR